MMKTQMKHTTTTTIGTPTGTTTPSRQEDLIFWYDSAYYDCHIHMNTDTNTDTTGVIKSSSDAFVNKQQLQQQRKNEEDANDMWRNISTEEGACMMFVDPLDISLQKVVVDRPPPNRQRDGRENTDNMDEEKEEDGEDVCNYHHHHHHHHTYYSTTNEQEQPQRGNDGGHQDDDDHYKTFYRKKYTGRCEPKILFVLLYNLAVAHHLSAAASTTTTNTTTTSQDDATVGGDAKVDNLNTSLRLYELAHSIYSDSIMSYFEDEDFDGFDDDYDFNDVDDDDDLMQDDSHHRLGAGDATELQRQYWMKEYEIEQSYFVHLKMKIVMNLSSIHYELSKRRTINSTSHTDQVQRCYQHLLSLIMYLVDYNATSSVANNNSIDAGIMVARTTTATTQEEEHRHLRQQQHIIVQRVLNHILPKLLHNSCCSPSAPAA